MRHRHAHAGQADTHLITHAIAVPPLPMYNAHIVTPHIPSPRTTQTAPWSKSWSGWVVWCGRCYGRMHARGYSLSLCRPLSNVRRRTGWSGHLLSPTGCHRHRRHHQAWSIHPDADRQDDAHSWDADSGALLVASRNALHQIRTSAHIHFSQNTIQLTSHSHTLSHVHIGRRDQGRWSPPFW